MKSYLTFYWLLSINSMLQIKNTSINYGEEHCVWSVICQAEKDGTRIDGDPTESWPVLDGRNYRLLTSDCTVFCATCGKGKAHIWQPAASCPALLKINGAHSVGFHTTICEVVFAFQHGTSRLDSFKGRLCMGSSQLAHAKALYSSTCLSGELQRWAPLFGVTPPDLRSLWGVWPPPRGAEDLPHRTPQCSSHSHLCIPPHQSGASPGCHKELDGLSQCAQIMWPHLVTL